MLEERGSRVCHACWGPSICEPVSPGDCQGCWYGEPQLGEAYGGGGVEAGAAAVPGDGASASPGDQAMTSRVVWPRLQQAAGRDEFVDTDRKL